jgi:hypothetical protein
MADQTTTLSGKPSGPAAGQRRFADSVPGCDIQKVFPHVSGCRSKTIGNSGVKVNNCFLHQDRITDLKR